MTTTWPSHPDGGLKPPWRPGSRGSRICSRSGPKPQKRNNRRFVDIKGGYHVPPDPEGPTIGDHMDKGCICASPLNPSARPVPACRAVVQQHHRLHLARTAVASSAVPVVSGLSTVHLEGGTDPPSLPKAHQAKSYGACRTPKTDYIETGISSWMCRPLHPDWTST